MDVHNFKSLVGCTGAVGGDCYWDWKHAMYDEDEDEYGDDDACACVSVRVSVCDALHTLYEYEYGDTEASWSHQVYHQRGRGKREEGRGRGSKQAGSSTGSDIGGEAAGSSDPAALRESAMALRMPYSRIFIFHLCVGPYKEVIFGRL